ncbi:MAG TPA: DUF5654 family protein [Methanocorpusculum sp.]|nr:DUF5654 family protein [Methanocorpusculum sp.]
MALSVEVIEKLSALITAAFGLVAAIAWNTAIQEIFKYFFGEQSSIPAMLGYAVFVTVLAVLFTIWIGVVAKKAKAVSEKVESKIPIKINKESEKKEE